MTPALSIVQWLVAHRVHATIFATGAAASTSAGHAVLALVAAHPDLFVLGNHSWSHADFRTLSAAQIADELHRTDELLAALVGRSTKPLFRPPYGGQDARVRSAVGAAGWSRTVTWDVDTIDWKPVADGGPTTADIVAKVRERATNGSIVLMHLGGYHTLEALPGVLDAVAANSLTPVTLRTLLGLG